LDEFCGGYFLLCHSHNAPRTVAQLRARRWQEMAGRGSGYDANINRDSLETLRLYGGPQTSSTVPYIFRASSRASDCSNISAWSRDRTNRPTGSFAGPVLSTNISTISPLAESVTEATTTCFSNMGVTPYRDTHLHFVAVEWGSRPPQQESDGEGQGEGRHS